MKKFFLVLSFFVIGNALAAVPRQSQSLFADVLIHKPVAIDSEKLAAAELIISSDHKWSFSQKIIDLHTKGKLIQRNIIPLLESKNIPVNSWTYFGSSLIVSAVSRVSNIQKHIFGKGLEIIDSESNLTEDNVRALINSYCKSTDNSVEPLDKNVIIELLKERKNTLIQEMHDKMWEQINKPSIGDIKTEDYAMFGTYGLGLLFGAPFMGKYWDGYRIGIAQGIGLSMAVVSLHQLRMYRYEIRSREQEMNYIDEIIKKIQSF